MWARNLLKETTGAFDGTQIHDRQVSTDYESNTLPTAHYRPCDPLTAPELQVLE